LENPLNNIYGGAILGGASFIKESINRLKGGILNRDETSYRKNMESSFQAEEIIKAVCDYYEISKDEVYKDRREHRNISIYLMKKLTGLTNNQIGRIFDNLSYSAVVKTHQRMSVAVNKKRAIRKKVEDITGNLS